MRLIAYVLLGWAATPAAAACVTSADLETGIRATAEDGETEVFRTIDTNLVENLVDLGDGLVVHYLMVHGLYIIDVYDRENGEILTDTRVVTVHGTDRDALPLPKPKMEWAATVAVRDSLGVVAEEQTYRWGDATTVSFGDCSYQGIAGTIRYETEDNWFVEDVVYLSNVGITLINALTDPVDGRVEFPPYVSLAAVGN